MPLHFFVTHNANWQKSNQKNFLLKESPSIIEVQNGIVLPPKRRLKIKKGQSSWAGGVCDSNGKWLAGLNRYQAFEKRAFGFGDCVGAYAFQKRKLHFPLDKCECVQYNIRAVKKNALQPFKESESRT